MDADERRFAVAQAAVLDRHRFFGGLASFYAVDCESTEFSGQPRLGDDPRFTGFPFELHGIDDYSRVRARQFARALGSAAGGCHSDHSHRYKQGVGLYFVRRFG